MIPAPPVRIARLVVALALGFWSLGATTSPVFMSLSRDKVFMREGPSYQHRVTWVYARKGLPVELLNSYDIWRRIRDPQGTVGWVHMTMLSDKRSVVVTSPKPAPIRDADGSGAKVIAYAQTGVVARLEACEADACEILASGTDGWIEKKDVWGVRPGEVFR